MQSYRRILTAVDLSSQGEKIVQHALNMARLCSAKLLVTHVVDYSTGFESDHFPFRTARELHAELARAAEEKIRGMLQRLDATGVEVRAAIGTAREAVMDLTAEWRADLVIVASYAPHGLQNRAAPANPFDTLIVQMDAPHSVGRLARTLTDPLIRLWSQTFGARA